MDIKPLDKRPVGGTEKESSNLSSDATKTETTERPSFTITTSSHNTEAQEPRVPYLASLSAFVLLFISTFYSLIGIVGYILDKTFVSRKTTDAETNIFSSYDIGSYFVIGEVSALVVSLPAAIALAFILRKYESSEPWRLKQKLRRGIYSVGAVFLILALVVSLISTVNGLFTTNIGLNYESLYSSNVTIDTGIENTKIALQGLFNIILLSVGLFALGSNYSGRRKNIIMIVLATLAVLSLALAPYAVNNVTNSIKEREAKIENQKQEQKQAQQKQEQEYQRLLNEDRYSIDINNSTDSYDNDIHKNQSPDTQTSSNDTNNQL
jgi:Na+-transporting methylmalonyl-CoA/oxaloacetate decarboxylase gamma subunit